MKILSISLRGLLAALISLVAAAYAQEAAAQLLYKITRADLTAPSYIFGTHHLAPPSMLDSAPRLRAALDSARLVVGEIDMTGSQTAMALSMQKYAAAPPDSTLSRLFTPKRFVELNDKFKALDLMPGLDLYGLDGMRPMVATNLITISIFGKSMPDYDPQQQLDMIIQQYAAANDKEIRPLETPELQARLIYTVLPLKEQAESLATLLEQPEKVMEASRAMNEAYLTRDIDRLLEISFRDDDNPEFAEALLDRRNTDWIATLKQAFAEGPAFVAVGALHLPGSKGLIHLLEAEGYTVIPVDTIKQE